MPAVGGIVSDNKKEYPGNLTPFVTVTCVVAAMGGLIFGYDIGISGKCPKRSSCKTHERKRGGGGGGN